MVKCNDCWCEHFDKSNGNCDKCVKNEEAKDRLDFEAILQRRTVKQMGIDRKNKEYEQTR